MSEQRYTSKMGAILDNGEPLTIEAVLELLNSAVWTRVEDGLPDKDEVVRYRSSEDLREEYHAEILSRDFHGMDEDVWLTTSGETFLVKPEDIWQPIPGLPR